MLRKRRLTVIYGVSLIGLCSVVVVAALLWRPLSEHWYLKKLSSERPEERMRAAAVLAERKSERAIPALIRLLPNQTIPDDKVFLMSLSEEPHYAVRALVAIGPGAIPLLIESLDSDDELFLAHVTEVLDKLGDDAITALIRALDHSDVRRRRSVINALAEILRSKPTVPVAAVQALTRLLDDADARTSALAASALAELGAHARSAIPNLLDKLGDHDREVRSLAALALGAITAGAPTAEVVDRLVALLADRSPIVMIRVTYALNAIGPAAQSAVPELLNLLRDPNPIAKESGAFALAGIGVATPEVLAALKELSISTDEDVSLAAREALNELANSN